MVQDQEVGVAPSMSTLKVAGLPTCGRGGLTRNRGILVAVGRGGDGDGRGSACPVPGGGGVGEGGCEGSPLVGSGCEVAGVPVGDVVGGGFAGSYLRMGVTVAVGVMMPARSLSGSL